MRISIGSTIIKTSKRLAIFGGAAFALGYGATAAQAEPIVSATPADLRVMVDMNPFSESAVVWLQGNATGKWADGLPLVGPDAPANFIGSPVAESEIEPYLILGMAGVSANVGIALGQSSYQLADAGRVNFSSNGNASPTRLEDAIQLNRITPKERPLDPSFPDDAPEQSLRQDVLDAMFGNLSILSLSWTGADASFFSLDSTLPIIMTSANRQAQLFEFDDPNSSPPGGVTVEAFTSSMSVDLLFTGTEQREYDATLELTTDTGLIIPFQISGTVVPEPASAVLLLTGGALLLRRRKGGAA